MGLSAIDAPVGGGACKNNVTCAVTHRHVNSHAGSEISECERV